MGRLKAYVRPFYGYIAFTMLIKLLGAVAELFIPYFMELVLGVGIESGRAPLIVLYGSGMLIAAIVCLALNILVYPALSPPLVPKQETFLSIQTETMCCVPNMQHIFQKDL